MTIMMITIIVNDDHGEVDDDDDTVDAESEFEPNRPITPQLGII